MHKGLAPQRTVFGWVGFVVFGSFWCAECFVPGLASHLGFGKNISAVHLFVCCYWLVEIAFDAHHPNPLLHFCKWDNLVPIHITQALVLLNLDLTVPGPGVQLLLQRVRICCTGGVGVGGRGNWPIFPQLKKIARHFPSLRPGGTCMNRGIFQWWGVVLWSWRFLILRVCWDDSICLGQLCSCVAGIKPGYYFHFYTSLLGLVFFFSLLPCILF